MLPSLFYRVETIQKISHWLTLQNCLEINTLNKTLNKEMQYMLGQRFNINGSNYDNDWGLWDSSVK